MDQYQSEDGIEHELGVKEANAAELGHVGVSATAFLGQEGEWIKASLARRLDEDWPGFKFGLDIKSHIRKTRGQRMCQAIQFQVYPTSWWLISWSREI